MHIDERLTLAELFVELLYRDPAVGNDHIHHVYALSRFDESDDIRARTLDFLFYSDENRDNVQRLVEHHMSSRGQLVFRGSMRGGRASWDFVDERLVGPRRGSSPRDTVAWLQSGIHRGLYGHNNQRLRSGAIDW